PLEAWYPKYRRVLDHAQATGLGWHAVEHLLAERGATSGVAPTGTVTHRTVTGMSRRHITALRTLTRRAPDRVGFGTVVPVAMLPGVRGDAELVAAASELAQTT